jgi:hypothetical protein
VQLPLGFLDGVSVGAAGGVVAQLGGCHHLGVGGALVVDRAAFLSVLAAGALEIGRIVHPQQGLLHQALAVGADRTGPVARRHALAALAHPAAAGGCGGGGGWDAGGHGVRLWRLGGGAQGVVGARRWGVAG